jgi:3',5'-cyclic-AMP phosphodiesterase
MHSEPLRIVHITDTHIIATPGAEVYGIDSFTALESLLAVMQRDAWTPHLLIATGDLSEDSSAVSYQRLRSLLTSVGLPVYCIPGNHDVLAAMHAHLRGGPLHLERRVVWEPWQIVLLDSQVPGQGHGSLSHKELTALEEALQEAPGRHTLVGLHHGPLPVCPMPPCRLENAAAFLAFLGRYPNVRGIISGHNHCAVDEQHRGIRMLVTPSTCVNGEHPRGSQALDGRPFWEVHSLDPGRRAFRRLELYPNGQIITEVIWDPAETPVGSRYHA